MNAIFTVNNPAIEHSSGVPV